MEWQQEQQLLQDSMIYEELFRPAVAGRFRDGRPQPHPWLRVIASGRHRSTGERWFSLQLGGSGASWWRESEVELFPDQPSP
jgi:hypothetical protein